MKRDGLLVAFGLVVLGCGGGAVPSATVSSGEADEATTPSGSSSPGDSDVVAPDATPSDNVRGPLPPPSAFATATPNAAACGDLSKLGMGAPQGLLQDRLTVRSVQGAEDVPVPWNVMGAPDAPTDRSRVYFEQGALGLAIVATERYQIASADFASKAKQRLDAPGGEVVAVKTGDPALRLIAWMPTDIPDGSSGTSFMLEGFLVHPDGAVQYLQVGTFPEQFTNVDGCRNLALKIAATLKPGSRALTSKSGSRSLEFFKNKFEATVPDGWVSSTQVGPDFVVVRLREQSDFPQPPPELVIALTDHPPPPDPTAASTSQPGTLLGKPVTWALGTVVNRENTEVFTASGRTKLGSSIADAHINALSSDARARALTIANSMKAVP